MKNIKIINSIPPKVPFVFLFIAHLLRSDSDIDNKRKNRKENASRLHSWSSLRVGAS